MTQQQTNPRMFCMLIHCRGLLYEQRPIWNSDGSSARSPLSIWRPCRAAAPLEEDDRSDDGSSERTL